MGFMTGPCHAATAAEGISHYPFAFSEFAAQQRIAPRQRVEPDLPVHFHRGTRYEPGGPPTMPEPPGEGQR